MTKTLLRRIGTLETRCGSAQTQLRVRVVLVAAESKVGVGKATCSRSRGPTGNLFEIVDFYGCAFSQGECGPEEQAFKSWIGTVPTDGVEREFSPSREQAPSREAKP